MTRNTRYILIACLMWAVAAVIHIAGHKMGLWERLDYPARYYGPNDTETP